MKEPAPGSVSKRQGGEKQTKRTNVNLWPPWVNIPAHTCDNTQTHKNDSRDLWVAQANKNEEEWVD